MTTQDIIILAVSSIIGSGGIIGVCFFIIKRAIEKKLDEEEAKRERKMEIRRQRDHIKDELLQAHSRCIFEICRSIPPTSRGAELTLAINDVEKLLATQRRIERDIINEFDDSK